MHVSPISVRRYIFKHIECVTECVDFVVLSAFVFIFVVFVALAVSMRAYVDLCCLP